jgi:microcystin-dependent protein
MEGIVPWERLSNLPTIQTGQGLEGGGELIEDITISLSDTAVDEGTYGSSQEIPILTVNSRGQITNATIQRITIPDSVDISNTGNSDSVAASTSYVYTVNQDLDNKVSKSGDTITGDLMFNGGTRYIGTNDGYGFVIGTDNTDRMTILSNGKVGIGTSNPTYTLHTFGDIGFTGTLQEGTVPWGRLSSHPTITTGTGLGGGGDLSTDRTISLSDTTVTAGTYGASGGIEYPRLVVDAQGRLTGVTSEAVRGATTAQTGIVQLSDSGSSTSLAATTSYVSTVNDNANLRVLKSGDTMTGNLMFSGGTRYIGTSDSNSFVVKTNDTDRLTVTSVGQVGVGKTPSSELDVSGDINFTGNITEDGVEIFTGVIAAFNGSCPTGWTEYTDARGRAVIGAGQGSGLTDRPLASTGGEETHVLTESEMPSHTHIQNAHSHSASSGSAGDHSHSGTTDSAGNHRHYLGEAGWKPSNPTSSGDRRLQLASGSVYSGYAGTHTHSFSTNTTGSHSHTVSVDNATATNQNTGGDDAHNNMQPYIALTYCQKQTGSDYAEWIPSNEDLEPATIVSIDLSKDETITASTKEYDSNVVGIVTTQPGWVIGEQNESSEAMALSGRVPVKVSLKNGNIERGDPITTSSIKGVGMKATKTGPIIGKAMEELNEESNLYECSDTKTGKIEQCGTITVFVNPTMHVQESFVLGSSDSKEGFFNGLANIIGQITSTIINTSIDVLGVSDDKVDTQDLLSRIESLEENQPSQALILKEKEDGSIELLGGKIIVEGDGTVNIKRLAAKSDYGTGSSTISAGELSTTISTKGVSKDSNIFITPTSNTKNNQLFVTDIKEEESFKVNIWKAIDTDITFDWFIVEER